MPDYWLSSERMTVRVTTDRSGIIRFCPMIVVRFLGQPLENLKRWMRKQPGFRYEVIP